MLERGLEALGLDEREQRFYLAALQLGDASINSVAVRAGVSRTNGYDLAARLEQRGLLTQEVVSGTKVVSARDPVLLLAQLARQKELLEDLVPTLRSLYNSRPFKPRIHFYDGVDGVRTVLWNTLTTSSGPLIGMLSMHELDESPGRQTMERYIAERVRRGISLRVLRSKNRESREIWPSSTAELRELRYVPDDVDISMTMYVHDHVVSYISSKSENFGLVIESKEIAALQRSMFGALWSISAAA